jgi:uncharacterized protein DUF4339
MADDQLLYAARDGRQIGPFSRNKLDVFLSSGQLEPSDFLWQEGWAQWTSVAVFLEHRSAQRIAAKFSAPRKSPRQWGPIRVAAAIIGFIGALGAALLLTLYQR